jgi:proteic killer suppression protein
MIKTFSDGLTMKLYLGENVAGKVAKELLPRIRRKLDLLDQASDINDLRVPPSNRLHPLDKDRKGQWSISINEQWRVCFKFKDGNAYEVEFCDYH